MSERETGASLKPSTTQGKPEAIQAVTSRIPKAESGGIFIVDNIVEDLPDEEEEAMYKVNFSNNRVEHLKKMLSFTDLRQVWNSYSQEQVFGKKVFEKTLFNEVRAAVLSSPQVMRTIHEQGKKSSIRATTHKAEEIADVMMAKMRESVVRPMAYLTTKVIHQLYSSIHVMESDIHKLQETAKQAQHDGISLVFLPTHKSHIDYIVLELLWFHCNISLPFIAGENLDIPLLGSLFHNCGAFYISRPFPNDPLYKSIFNEYIAQLLVRGYNLEFFPEGGRSRSGKLLPPKLGMVSSILQCFHDKRVKDCYFVPISISYEKVIETGTYIQELLGKAKQPERAAEVLRFNFGQIDIRVGDAVSIKELVHSLVESRGMPLDSLFHKPGNEHTVARDRFKVSRYVAFDMLHRINDISVATPSAMVVTCLLTNIGRGLGRTEMIENVRWLRNEILIRGGHISVFGLDNVETMVDRVTLLLRSCIARQVQMEVIYSPSKRFELSFYRNQLIHLFVGEATLACALYGDLNDFTPGIFVPRQAVEAETMFLSSLFKYEFIYKPKSAGEFSENFRSTLSQMVDRGILGYDEESDEICIARSGPKAYSFLSMFLWPFIESYWVAFMGLWSLYPNELVEIKEYLQGAQKFAETLYHRGELTFFEAISIGNLQAALMRFEEMGIIEKQVINDKGTSVIKLAKEFQNKNNFRAGVEHLGKFRRFGKYKKEPNFSKNVRKLAKGIVSTKQRSKM